MVLKIFSGPGGGGGEKADLTLPLGHSKQDPASPQTVQVFPLTLGDGEHGVIVRVQPPEKPANDNLDHIPCDLVLSIDVSGSMQTEAPMPTQADGQEGPQEDSGLSVLDLVKHAARTILETLGDRDRLGIVTFASRTKVLLPLTPMTAGNKAKALEKIESMRPLDMTNLWHGIRDGLSLFKEGGSTGRVPALLVLTDGLPNHMCPQMGYVPKLRMETLPASIHTFGFGYSLDSGLLKSIAEVGNGNYSFIPDAGMIGTVFVHAAANLQATYANNAKLRLMYPSYLKLQETTGEAVEKEEPVQVEGDIPEALTSLNIHLGNLQYGQTRDIYLRCGNSTAIIQAEATDNLPPLITAVLQYQHFTATTHETAAHRSALDVSSQPALAPAEVAYHVSRSALINFLSTFYPMDASSNHRPLSVVTGDIPGRLEHLLATLPAFNPEFLAQHAGCRALLTDLCGTPTLPTTPPASWTGQIALATLNRTYYARWGKHYLPSLAGAHARQVCNSFKDAGPLQYGAGSPLFKACRDRLDAAFDSLPAPAPSRHVSRARSHSRGSSHSTGGGTGRSAGFSMRSYNRAGNGCFAGFVRVALAGSGGGEIPIDRLRRGMQVVTPRGPRRVVGVLRMNLANAEMRAFGPPGGGGEPALVVTPWHPVRVQGAAGWEFPRNLASKKAKYTGPVYSVLLERDEDVDAHAILVGGMWGVAMGHGLTQAAGKRRDVRAHGFYGDYDKVLHALAKLPMRIPGVGISGGLARDPETGLVSGFKPRVKGTARRQVKGGMARHRAAITV